jgi:hypothetical protein
MMMHKLEFENETELNDLKEKLQNETKRRKKNDDHMKDLNELKSP